MSNLLAERIVAGEVGVMPTDTIYGLVGLALDKKVYERIVNIKSRDFSKKFVILISDWSDLPELGINISQAQKKELNQIWPGPVTAVLDVGCSPEHLIAADQTIAVRWPKETWLANIIGQTGPIIATSVNKQDEPFLDSMKEIKNLFPNLDFYIEGKVNTAPSKILRIDKEGRIKGLR